MNTDEKKLELINFIINEALTQTIDGLYEMFINEDFTEGISELDSAYNGRVKKILKEWMCE